MAFVVDQTSELWLKIDQLHLNYLKSEENTRKIDIRNKLEGFIHQYLCLVPQDRKFCSPLTTVILFESARWISDFSALKAARAFEAVEKYAANLINQPWRKEFKEIKQYGGFYKHQVESFLSGAERLFQQMGYVASGHESFVLPGPVDQDRVITVARDCVLAYVECQIIVSILQGVTAQFPCRWDEVLEFRRNHIGTPEQAVRAMVYQKNQLQFAASAAAAYNNPQPPYFTPSSNHYHHHPMNTMVPCGYQTHPGLIPGMMPGKPYVNGNVPPVVPTAKLVEVSPPVQNVRETHGTNGQDGGNNSSGSSSSTVTGGRRVPIPLTIKHLEEENKRKTILLADAAAKAVSAGNGNPLESWDYVYRQLESIGYTKDQGERPDVLDILSKVHGMTPQHREQLEKHLRLTRRQQGSSPEDDSEAIGGRSSPLVESKPQLPKKAGRHTQPLQPPKLPEKKRYQPPQQLEEEADLEADDKWNCHACTYLNLLDKDICDMCGKSRRVLNSRGQQRTETSEDEFVSGRSNQDEDEEAAGEDEEAADEEEEEDENSIQCPKCTLFNDNSLKACEACGASLHFAPIAEVDSKKQPRSSSAASFNHRQS